MNSLALQLCRRQFSHKKNFVADFIQAKFDYRGKTAFFAFLSTPLGDLGATYGDRLRLVGKRVGNSY